MTILRLMSMALLMNSAFALTYITCGNGEYSTVINVDDREGLPPQSGFTVYRNGKMVKSSVFKKHFGGPSKGRSFFLNPLTLFKR